MTKKQIERKIRMWEDKLDSARMESATKFATNVGWGYGMRHVHIPVYDSRVKHCNERIEYYKSLLATVNS